MPTASRRRTCVRGRAKHTGSATNKHPAWRWPSGKPARFGVFFRADEVKEMDAPRQMTRWKPHHDGDGQVPFKLGDVWPNRGRLPTPDRKKLRKGTQDAASYTLATSTAKSQEVKLENDRSTKYANTWIRIPIYAKDGLKKSPEVQRPKLPYEQEVQYMRRTGYRKVRKCKVPHASLKKFEEWETCIKKIGWCPTPAENAVLHAWLMARYTRMKQGNQTKTDSHPIPRMDDYIDKTGKAKYITKCDLLKGYWCVPLTERATEISAFVTPDGIYLYCVNPFGMKNCQATFQRMTNQCLNVT